MIFFATGDGTIIKTLPSPVYQGSENASKIYLIAPFSPNLKVTVRFHLPNGVWTTPTLMDNGLIDGNQMTAQGPLASPDGAIVDKETGKKYAVWTKPISGEVTQYYGTVTAQFFFYAAQGGIVTSTSAANFTVGRGVPTVLPDAPTEDVYEAILSNLSALQEQLDNGAYTARSIYAWNSYYTYGANEIVFYPDKEEYGVFLKSLVTNNTTEPYMDGVLNSNKWEEVVDFNVLNELYSLKNDLNDAIETANEAIQRAENAEQSATSSAQSAANSAAESEERAQRVEAAAEYLDNVQNGKTAVPKAVADDAGNNIAEQFENIESYIPSSTSADNKLANEAFVNSSINNMAAFYITRNTQGEAFATKADLLNASTFYSGGQARVPTQNDYAIVLADESQPVGVDGSYPTTRYSYQGGTYPNGQWDFQYVVNNTSLTQAQVNAINSGITAEKIALMDSETAAKYTKPSSGIPESDLSENVQAKLNASSGGYIKNLYNLSAFDTYISDGDGTATITRKTGYVSSCAGLGWYFGNSVTVNGVLCDVFYVDINGVAKPTMSNLKLSDYTNITPQQGNAAYTIRTTSDGNFQISLPNDITQKSVENLKKYLLENDFSIQYELATSYTETAIDNQPIHTLNQDGEQWLNNEWEKGLNLLNLIKNTYTKSGLTIEHLSPSQVKINGTNTIGNCDIYLMGSASGGSYTSLDPTKYYCCTANNGGFSAFSVIISGGNVIGYGGSDGKYDPSQYSNVTEVRYFVRVPVGAYSNRIINIMLNEGSHPYPYEPYNGGIVRENELNGYVSKSGDTMTGQLYMEQLSGDTFYHSKRTDTGNSIKFGVGAGGVNRGIYDDPLNKWILYTDGSKVYVNGAEPWSNQNRPTATKYSAYAETSQKTDQTDTVVEYYRASSGYFWYRKWASGWKECGGCYKNMNTSAGNHDVTFSHGFAFFDPYYTITFGSERQDSSTNTQVKELGYLEKDTNGFTKYFPKQGYEPTTWYYCCGY